MLADSIVVTSLNSFRRISTENPKMVREKDLCWEYGEKLDGNKVKCKFCLRILNGGISRLKHHLSRLPSRGVVPCTKVRDDVTDRVNAIITMKEEGKSVSSSKRRRLAEAKSPANVPVSKSVMCLEATTVMKPLSSVAQVSPLSSDYDWENAESVAVSEPLLRVMREVSGGKPFVGSIYDSMTKAMESIRTYYIMDENKCKVFLDIVDKRWKNQLHSPLHAAAAFLNPSIQYNPDIKFLGHVKEEFLNVLEKLLPTPESRHDITEQIIYFKKAQGMFGNNLAREARNTISPGLWWEQYGDSAPGLQRVAVRILSQVCSGSIFENWSAFQNIHTEKRNRLDKETLNDIIYINSNLKLASRMKVKPAETDPLLSDEIDMTSDWVEETESPSSSQWLDRFGSTLEGSDLNTRQFTNAMFGASDHIFGL
ncbi:hypothetical protein GIB67_006354 [Kingdonia uniflora]|uniref:BED-type domain-containing protein n=1 Tax=Kingdonia uniflora TaxID=39325 RepID=A0A7J7P1C7_9MAGN|nr:hypothetical protein GIB67_006354 [Kingdonia uniflora]